MTEVKFTEPAEIERESFRIIDEILRSEGFFLKGAESDVLKRVIHTTADFSFKDTLKFTDDVISKGIELIRNGALIATDTNMALAGINRRVEKYGCTLKCLMNDPEVRDIAEKRHLTRAIVSMEKIMDIDMPKIIAVGNSPTALIRLYEIMEEKSLMPDLLIGVPVGFVNVEYSKNLFLNTKIPYIINTGRKGGSTVAASIINALSLLADKS